MKTRPRKLTFPVLILAGLAFSACASTQEASLRQVSASSNKSLADGDFQKALDPFKEAYRKTPNDKTLIAEYLRTVEVIKQNADQAFGQRDYVRAENIYGLVLENIADFGVIASGLTFTINSLEEKLIDCRVATSSNKSLADGDFQKALDPFKEAYRKTPNDETLIAEYLKTVEVIKQNADQAFGQRNYVQAGNIYRLVLENIADFGGLASGLTFTKNSLEKKLKDCRVATGSIQYEQSRKAGSFEKALSVYQALIKYYPGDIVLAAAYTKAGNDIKAAADKARAQGDFATAGRAYALLLKNYATFKGLQPQVVYTQKDLAESIAICRTVLTNKGLAEYRSGNLANALAIWESLLAFDPTNAQIKKAVETAKAQVDKLVKKSTLDSPA